MKKIIYLSYLLFLFSCKQRIEKVETNEINIFLNNEKVELKSENPFNKKNRTLPTILALKRLYSEEAEKTMSLIKIDTAQISSILRNGDIDFGKGNPRQKPCAEYYVTGKKELEKVNLLVKRCDSTATIEKIIVE
ncbi:DUF4258 domain-containing protein [Polaribacter aquimarinus]|uniref:DUF4258 domain-containing protein n=1 Tax=Polaribacter aquimarinus TaxID=2100726 RepID=A0A2U2J7K4_9FLAO|nr:DUF4258 domain-containing protein [Polaribacter aquimarinus]PWG04323.1 hypothetical protein DIS07_13015 [Polaribacter aquimarinus]